MYCATVNSLLMKLTLHSLPLEIGTLYWPHISRWLLLARARFLRVLWDRKPMVFLGSFWSCKNTSSLDIFDLKPKKVCDFFCKFSMILGFFLKYFAHIAQCYALNVFSTWIITWIKLVMSQLWGKFHDEMIHKKTFANKTPNICPLLVEDIKISDNFNIIQNFLRIFWLQ